MEALLPDKMAHVEELRLIQSDISLVSLFIASSLFSSNLKQFECTSD